MGDFLLIFKMCPSWTHFRLVTLLDPPVSKLDTISAGNSLDPPVSNLDTFSAGGSLGSSGVHVHSILIDVSCKEVTD